MLNHTWQDTVCTSALTTELPALGLAKLIVLYILVHLPCHPDSSGPCDRLQIQQHIQVHKIAVVLFRPVLKQIQKHYQS
jgi:hypothetical protein